MKKKIMFLLSAVMLSFAMTTCASAASVKGDVDSNGTVDTADVSYIMQYVLNHSFNFGAIPFDKSAADFVDDGVVDAFDAASLYQAILSGEFEETVQIKVTLPGGTQITDIFDYSDDTTVMTVLDDIFVNGKYDDIVIPKTATGIANLNTRINNFKIKSKLADQSFTLKDAEGWTIATAILNPIIADATAFNAMQPTNITTWADMQALYANAKVAFPASKMTKANLEAVINNSDAEIGRRMVSASIEAEKITLTTMDSIIAYAVANNLNNYDAVTVGQVKELFGNSFTLKLRNTAVKVELVTL